MRRLLSVLVPLAVLVAFPLATAQAQPTLDEVVQEVDADGVYIETAADADEAAVLAALGGASDIGVVILAEDDPDGADVAADQVRDGLGVDIVVLVITPGEVAASDSDFFSDDELDAALDQAFLSLEGSDDIDLAVAAFAGSLASATGQQPAATATPTPQPASSSSGGGGAGGFIIFLLVIVGLIGGFIWWAKRKAKKVDTGEIERARAEIKSQLASVASDIVDNEHAVDLSGNADAVAHYRHASATYNRVAEAVDATENLLELAELNDDIDHARWQLEAAEALMDGRPVPPEPEPEKPAACFFDPTHKPGTEECTITTSAGDKEVRVCRQCAGKLERGERPEPRMIDVGGKRVPAAKAPRSHGGLGMGGLSIFEVILGGLGALTAARGRRTPQGSQSSAARRGVGLDWGDRLPNRRPTGSVFGPDRQPPRPRGLPKTRASRSPRPSGGRRVRTRSSSGRRRTRKR